MADPLFRTILVPTDGSDGAERAVDHAVALAKQNDATLHALYVIDTGEMGFAAIPDDIAETKDRLRKRGEKLTRRVADRAAAEGVECVTATESGIAHEEILEYAEKVDADLVVMGKHGRLDPGRHLLGSVTDRVLKLSRIPVHSV